MASNSAERQYSCNPLARNKIQQIAATQRQVNFHHLQFSLVKVGKNRKPSSDKELRDN